MSRCTDSISSDYLSPMRTHTIAGRGASHEGQKGTSTKGKFTTILRGSSPPRVDIPSLRGEEITRTPSNNSNSSDYLSTSLGTLPIPLTPSTPDSSSFFDTTELFDAFPSVPQNLPTGPGTSLLSGFELRTSSELGLGGRLGKAATISSSYQPKSSYR